MVRDRGGGGRSRRRKDRLQKLSNQSKIGLDIWKKASCTQRKGFDSANKMKDSIKDI
jgi:hypothetical protein